MKIDSASPQWTVNGSVVCRLVQPGVIQKTRVFLNQKPGVLQSQATASHSLGRRSLGASAPETALREAKEAPFWVKRIQAQPTRPVLGVGSHFVVLAVFQERLRKGSMVVCCAYVG